MSKAVWFSIVVGVFFFGCGQSKEQAVQELEKLNVKFTPDDFVQSAEKGDTKAIQLFLNAGIDCNVQSVAGVTALMAAAKNGRVDVVNKLLEQKLNVDAQGKQGVTALMLAAENNQVEIVKHTSQEECGSKPGRPNRVVGSDEGGVSREHYLR